MDLRSSTTVTVKLLVTEFPVASVKVYVTGVVCPVGKESPGFLVFVGVTVPELSKAVGSFQVTGVFGVPNGTDTVMSSGKLTINGLVASAMVRGERKQTRNVLFLVLFQKVRGKFIGKISNGIETVSWLFVHLVLPSLKKTYAVPPR